MVTTAQVREFLARLSGPDGCNVQQDEAQRCGALGHEDDLGQYHTISRRILAEMGIPEPEAVAFIERCRHLAGHCDCCVLTNAGEALLAPTSAR
jgi:hypothetical protein